MCINFNCSYQELHCFFPGKPASDCSKKTSNLTSSDSLEKNWHCRLIKYLQKNVFNPVPKDNHADKVATLGEEALVSSTMRKWIAEFGGSGNLEDDKMSRHPATATTEEYNRLCSPCGD